MNRLHFAQVQHPVGQGGFHTGWLFDPAIPIRLGTNAQGRIAFAWAYDCGSDQLSALHSQIQNVGGTAFKVLFLSHLDDDHVVGVDRLLTASRVDEVVLPYIGDNEWALHLAASASAGTLSGTFIDLAGDPAGWFGARGVQRLIYIETYGDDDDGPDGPDPVDPGDSDPDRLRKFADGAEHAIEPIKLAWSRPPRPLGQSATKNGSAEIMVVSRGAVASLYTPGRTLNWVLSPFAFRPSVARMHKFEAKLVTKFGAGLTARQYADAARTPQGRLDLRECFDAVWTTHNLHSMALYSGPAVAVLNKLHNTVWHGKFTHRVVQPGWISTGDFDGTVKKRRQALLRYYARYAHTVGQLTLPHHGSDLSFDASILPAFPDLSFAIAAVGNNGHGHPGKGVQAAVASIPAVGFVRVDERPSSFYQIVGPV